VAWVPRSAPVSGWLIWLPAALHCCSLCALLLPARLPAAVTDRDGCTPLYCAAAWNRIPAVRLLEQLHCPSSLRSLEGRTAVHVAAEQVCVGMGRHMQRQLLCHYCSMWLAHTVSTVARHKQQYQHHTC
jgi:ankyrin repeat protein